MSEADHGSQQGWAAVRKTVSSQAREMIEHGLNKDGIPMDGFFSIVCKAIHANKDDYRLIRTQHNQVSVAVVYVRNSSTIAIRSG